MAQTKRSRTIRTVLIDLSIMTVIGVVLALIGPFGSFDAPLAVRLVSWLAFAYLGYAIYRPMGMVVDRLHRALDLPEPGLWVAACLVATIPMTAIVWSIGFLPGDIRSPSLQEALTLYFYVLVVGGGVTVLFHILDTGGAGDPDDERETREAADDAHVSPADPRFIDRLPPELGSDLIALEMEDHYVRAHTALGSDLVLMRMRDAVAELEGIDGAQVHRSWWVARGAVERVLREGRNIRLVLAGGLEAPVSRANVSTLKERGWI